MLSSWLCDSRRRSKHVAEAVAVPAVGVPAVVAEVVLDRTIPATAVGTSSRW